MKLLSWKAWLGISLIAASGLLYFLNFLIFRDVDYMFRLFLAQLGFLPISVLLVTIIIAQLLSQRAKQDKLAKLNMVIGAFFSEVGLSLLKMMAGGDPTLRQETTAISTWSDSDFLRFYRSLAQYGPNLALSAEALETLRNFLRQKRDFLLRLLENPNLLEHDSFSNLLLAVFHLIEELAQRPDLQRLTAADREHLAGDVRRAYAQLIAEWAAYMRYLKRRYPYLFSLAVRTNPFDPHATAEIKD